MLGLVSDGWGFATMQAIGDGGVREAKLFCSSMQQQAVGVHSLNCRLEASFTVTSIVSGRVIVSGRAIAGGRATVGGRAAVGGRVVVHHHGGLVE